MKKTKMINSDMSRVIAQMGHFDKLSIGDAGMPVPMGIEKIDLAVDNGIPSFMQVLTNVLEELEVQRIYLAEEIKTENPKMLENIKALMPETPITFMPHSDMKQDLNNCHAFVRTGEMTPYSNIILESGVVF
ncbi:MULTISPECIES: D-ribose pyranase [Pediococcus]|uniref:D-ribose pyranase n=1 Tax=Pediococcus pentosaceus (strain ATCC 25745 / CCUG 21536 / LMG 10740 / 183-1w) TaxID=278197 RepID=RBSD_PEDPA|nr:MULTISPECIES: D-ribose pyranase [Pediococcus]Q03DK3.1 RecName: Full=D-ribose pyranase [Pediococcus pentosaceus ATCC 25745]ABJ68719.1 ABC-type ribose transport system, auxiliary component [Pediococcus pentosaceus ATCC 25745]AVL02134.1 D-ribose pyranase [Pediococcus pentosaceus]KAF0423041.1 D-ribose pyranase [Pediococcus pentosaceus]KAF5440123.1 D-ribose pyranase [Pediococcus sp. EKM202D]KAF5440432.1 D-ribose pyranase [Pediococcus sp. EKM201D]